jgi:hypothetical protein
MENAMRQMTLVSQGSFEKYARKSRREEFLSVMAAVVPWRELEALIEPYYPKAGNGRQPVGLSIMLRVYFLQQWFSLSDPGAEDALYESPRPCCGASQASIWAALLRPTRRRFFAFAACSKSTSYAGRYSMQ